ncbi:MAG TPA: DUF1569 domain-containing protein [Thermoanaerobaculia bacterium]|jgi:hypothetical protein|nr:DUF1569 domain-containing protein [Thermoanaerobaculia bacterium]
MKTLFDQADRESICQRLGVLQAGSPRQWGKMNAAQMVTHCARALETGTGDRPMKQKFLGRIITPFIRSSILGEKPFGRNAPTDPSFVVADQREFAVERQRLLDLIDRLVERGTAAAATQTHAFFGKLTGEEWGQLMYKHIDHHLQQFGV